MPELASALSGAHVEGDVSVHEVGLRGMVTLRADLGAPGVAEAIAGVTGADLPERGSVTQKGDTLVAWMSPDELLVMCAHDAADAMAADLTKALGDIPSLVVNVSDARAVFRVSGAGARDTLAKLAPVDFSSDAFPAGTFRRTRMAQVAAAIWADEDGSLSVICFRSVAQYVFDVLCLSAKPGGEVGFHAP